MGQVNTFRMWASGAVLQLGSGKCTWARVESAV